MLDLLSTGLINGSVGVLGRAGEPVERHTTSLLVLEGGVRYGSNRELELWFSTFTFFFEEGVSNESKADILERHPTFAFLLEGGVPVDSSPKSSGSGSDTSTVHSIARKC